ncbi:MAG: serine hydroxymethyltransferase [Parcubacteria group bacterium]|nr:serine hydroxymethyltransferase [Parcubacteria group bacterium]
MPYHYENLKEADPVLAELVRLEINRQQNTLDLIPSENIVPLAMLEVIGSPLTNKYSEGYAGKRYYPGNEYYDKIEEIAKERALKAFGLDPNEWHVNVQAHSGSPANLAVYVGLLEIGETLMGLQLSHGGHLTHGHKVSFTGRVWKAVQYGLDERSGLIDFTQVEELAREARPKVIVSGTTAYPRTLEFEKFGRIAKEVGAYHVADVSHIAGLILGGVHPNPFPHADVVTATTHKTLRGPRGALIFCRKELAEKIDKAIFPGLQGGPHNNITAGIALMFHYAMQPEFKTYQEQIVKNAKALADHLLTFDFELVSGGTDNHLMVVDLRNKGMDGMEGQNRLEQAGIIANRNTVPGDPSPFKPSGIRAGTPAVTTRGFKEGEMEKIAEWFERLLGKSEPAEEVKVEVEDLCRKYPLEY